MKKYEKPELVIVEIEIEDILTVSGPDIDGGFVVFPNIWEQQ